MRKVLILGAGESGTGTAVLAKKKGYGVFVSDSGPVAEPYRGELLREGIPFEENGHSPGLLEGVDVVVKSPGIPESAPLVEEARGRGVAVISEIEFAAPYCRSRVIAITGSNGKTTTTMLTDHILHSAGVRSAAVGNIGDSFARAVAAADNDILVLEISSFQLDGIVDFRHEVSVLLNITPDHLDRYGYDMELYARSKMRIAMNSREGDTFICNGTDRWIEKFAGMAGKGARVPFFTHPECAVTDGAWFDGEGIHCRLRGAALDLPVGGLKVRGVHNYSNVMAAALAAMAVGVAPKDIAAGAATFDGVPHRLETVGEVEGVEYINDSKATNTDAAWYALDSMARPVVWVAGGTDKGNDYGTLKGLAEAKVRALICLGADNSKLINAFDGIIPEVREARSMEEALAAARELSAEGDVVLLSPACASFDLFRNYVDRGDRFREGVKAMMLKK